MSSHENPRVTGEPNRRWLTPGVGAVGAASFFSDTGHEVTTSVLPTFLTGTLGASAAALGVIDGISDALIGVMKLVGGPLANNPDRRGRTASGGYLGTALATGAIGAAVTVWQAGIFRAIAWLSRGLRSPARDALLASLSPGSAHGRAFGLERAGDNLGAVAGPLLAAGLVAWVGVRPTLYLAAIPGLFAAVAIIVAARESRQQIRFGGEPAARRLELRALRDAGMVRALLPVALFEFGNLATTLLILRATQLLSSPQRTLTAATSLAILIYAGHNAVATAASLAVGRWYDRTGPRAVFATGGRIRHRLRGVRRRSAQRDSGRAGLRTRRGRHRTYRANSIGRYFPASSRPLARQRIRRARGGAGNRRCGRDGRRGTALHAGIARGGLRLRGCVDVGCGHCFWHAASFVGIVTGRRRPPRCQPDCTRSRPT